MIFNMPVYAGWTPAERISDEATVYHPRIASNGDFLHVVYSVDESGDSRIYYLRSEDSGVSWDTQLLFVDTLATFANVFPNVRTNIDTAYALWRNSFRGGGGRNLSFRRSLDNGQTWQPVTYILSSNNYEFQKHAFCVSGRKIFVVFSHYDDDLIYEFVKSANGGQTWSEPAEIFRADQSGSIDLIARGDTIHLVWAGRFESGADWEVYYMKSNNAGEDWTENFLITSDDNIHSYWPSLSINNRGEAIICWMDYKYSPPGYTGDLFVRYSYDSGGSWTEEEQITYTHKALAPRAIWQSDSIHIAWEDHRFNQEDIFYMLSVDNGLTWGEEERIDDEPARSESPDLAISGEHRFIVWKDNRYDPGPGVYLSLWDPDVSINEDHLLPADIGLLTAYPNPFNSKTLINYSNLEGGDIDFYDITGRLVKTLDCGGGQEGKVIWDATDASGEKVSSGVYFARARTPQGFISTKLVYLK